VSEKLLKNRFFTTNFGDGHAKEEEGREERRKERGEKVDFKHLQASPRPVSHDYFSFALVS